VLRDDAVATFAAAADPPPKAGSKIPPADVGTMMLQDRLAELVPYYAAEGPALPPSTETKANQIGDRVPNDVNVASPVIAKGFQAQTQVNEIRINVIDRIRQEARPQQVIVDVAESPVDVHFYAPFLLPPE